MLTEKKRNLFFILSFFMGTVVIASNYLVQFPVKLYNLENILTYGAFSYPITFLITDLANRAFGKKIARYVVLVGFFIGISLTLFVSTNFSDTISIRIAWICHSLFYCTKSWCKYFWQVKKKKMVHSSTNIFNFWIDRRYFSFFLHCIL